MSVVAYLTQSGLTAKVHACYGKQMAEAELAALAELDNIPEALALLQGRELWAQEWVSATQRERHRVPDEALEIEFRSLGRFVAPQDKRFWQFFSHQQDLRRLVGDYHRFSTVEDFRSAAAGTIYEGSVSRGVQGERLPDFAAVEALLRSRYDDYLLRLIGANYKGVVGQRLGRLLGEATDRVNLLNLLRLKTYFPAQAERLARYLPAHHRLTQRLYARLSGAKNVEDARSILAAEPHFAALAGLPLGELEREQVRSLRRLYRQMIHSGEPSVVVAFAYLSDRGYALAELCAALGAVADRQASKKEATTW